MWSDFESDNLIQFRKPNCTSLEETVFLTKIIYKQWVKPSSYCKTVDWFNRDLSIYSLFFLICTTVHFEKNVNRNLRHRIGYTKFAVFGSTSNVYGFWNKNVQRWNIYFCTKLWWLRLLASYCKIMLITHLKV